ncbi:hypothetical protein Tco_0016849 [Tanacetum coccineum]
MPWVLDVKMHLESMGIAQTIVENNDSPPQDKARANIFLRKHIDDGLKFEYLTTEDPSILWKDLKDRFDNQREVLLPVLKLCGQTVTDADMLEKTYSTFHASNMTLCGSSNHWAKSCRTAPHLGELYQASLKEKEGEVNLVDQVDIGNNDLDTSDFFSGDTELNTPDFFSDLDI